MKEEEKQYPKTFEELFANTSIKPKTDENGNTNWNFKATIKKECIKNKTVCKEMYSEEDLKEAFKQSRQVFIYQKDMPPLFENFEQWFEQYKK